MESPVGMASSIRSNSDSKMSMLDPKKPHRNGFGSGESPLAAQLQQVWLQTQLPKRNVPRSVEFLSPVPSPDYLIRSVSSASLSQPSSQSVVSPQDSSSDLYHSNSHSDVGSVSPPTQNESEADSDNMEEDYVLQYLSDILMEEDLSEKKCMYVQCSAYQAMNDELAELISETVPAEQLSEYLGQENDAADNTSWIDEVLTSNPHEFNSEDKINSTDYLVDEVSCMGIKENNQTRSVQSTVFAVLPHPPIAGGEVVDDLYCGVYPEGADVVAGIDYANGKSGVESLVELYPLLMQCAQAVAADDVRTANQLINELRRKSSPFGDGGQRMTYYFVEALVARLSGTGAQLYTALTSNRPNAIEMLKALRLFMLCNPLPKIAHFFANATIFKAIQGSERVHIIDFGILYGAQWPCLFRKLSQREGGPPHVRITGIDFAQPGFNKNERVDETGRRLAEVAKQFGVEFEYHAIAGKWEAIQPSQLTIRNDETLIVNCMFRLRNLLDETVMASSPRKIVLSKIAALNPKVFIMGVVSAGYNSPFFMARFRETINHFSALFDLTHSSLPPETDLRRLAEREVMGREILNVIACEGTERVERAESYRQWQSRSLNAGFKQEPVDQEIFLKAHDILRRYHKNYGVGQDGNWMLTGWRDRVLHGLTSWTTA